MMSYVDITEAREELKTVQRIAQGISSNEYLDKFKNIYGKEHPTLMDEMDRLNTKYRNPSKMADRIDVCKKYSFAIPNDKAIRKIAEFNPIIEIGSGTGYWAMLLQNAGVDIVAVDNNSWGHKWTKKWFESHIGNEGCLKNPEFKDRTLFLCWPPLEDEMARRALENYRGNTFIYVGELWGGCCAEDSFFEILDNEWEELETINIPQWPCIHDYLIVYRRLDI